MNDLRLSSFVTFVSKALIRLFVIALSPVTLNTSRYHVSMRNTQRLKSGNNN